MPGLKSAREVMDSWYDEWRYMQKTVDWGILTYTMHPYVIGRGFRMYALEGLVDKLMAEGAVFMTMEEAAREAKAKLFPDL
jgi:peptidoglycan-N-acetylglucosamine deacetylase